MRALGYHWVRLFTRARAGRGVTNGPNAGGLAPEEVAELEAHMKADAARRNAAGWDEVDRAIARLHSAGGGGGLV